MASGIYNKYASGVDSGWVEYKNPTEFTGSFYFRKIGNIVQVRAYSIELVSDVNMNNGKSIGNIPSGFAPNTTTICSVTVSARLFTKPIVVSFYGSNNLIYITANQDSKIPASTPFSLSTVYFVD